MYRTNINVPTQGRGTYDITSQAMKLVVESEIGEGLCNLFIAHTSASLIVCENADPDVRVDLERFLSDLVPDGDPRYRHQDEGPDDMPAHVRSVLTSTSLCIPVAQGRLALGTWQGIFLYEHRHAAHKREVTLTIVN